MSEFNEVNLQNRVRAPVRARVLVFTNSTRVEFVDRDLTRSFPLYGLIGTYNDKEGITFCCEFDGYLTFDEGSHYRILEMGPFEKVDFNPVSVRVYCADPIPPIVQFASATGSPTYDAATYTYRYADVLVYLSLQGGFQAQRMFRRIDGGLPYSEFDAEVRSVFVQGSVYQGPRAYPGYRFIS